MTVIISCTASRLEFDTTMMHQPLINQSARCLKREREVEKQLCRKFVCLKGEEEKGKKIDCGIEGRKRWRKEEVKGKGKKKEMRKDEGRMKDTMKEETKKYVPVRLPFSKCAVFVCLFVAI